MQNRIKSRKYFLYTSIKISENVNIKHLRWSKADLPKEKKKDSNERYSTNFRSSHPEVYHCKKGVLKKFATCLLLLAYANIISQDFSTTMEGKPTL